MKHDELGFTTLVLLVVAAMIGVGVFSSSGFALYDLGNPGRVLCAWMLCGVWAIAGAVAYGALAKRIPLSGGEYLYLSRLMHASIGFLAGWISLVAGFTAPIAAAAKAVVAYGLPNVTSNSTANGVASLVIVVACLFHAARLGIGAMAQNAIVALKLFFIACLLIWAFGFCPSELWQGGPLPGRDAAWLPSDFAGWAKLCASMSWIAFSYVGFNAAVYVAGESKLAQSNVPRAMLWATILVTIIYVLLNVVFVFAPPSTDVVADPSSMQAIAAIASRALGGSAMESLTRVIISLAVLSSVFGMLLAGPRVYMQMARDGVMPGLLKTAGSVPRRAIVTQAALSIAVVWIAQLDEIIAYLGMTLSACSGLAVAALWRLRSSSGSRDALERMPLTWVEQAAAVLYICGTLVMLAAVVFDGKRIQEVGAVVVTFVLGLCLHFAWQAVGPRDGTRQSEVVSQ